MEAPLPLDSSSPSSLCSIHKISPSPSFPVKLKGMASCSFPTVPRHPAEVKSRRPRREEYFMSVFLLPAATRPRARARQGRSPDPQPPGGVHGSCSDLHSSIYPFCFSRPYSSHFDQAPEAETILHPSPYNCCCCCCCPRRRSSAWHMLLTFLGHAPQSCISKTRPPRPNPLSMILRFKHKASINTCMSNLQSPCRKVDQSPNSGNKGVPEEEEWHSGILFVAGGDTGGRTRRRRTPCAGLEVAGATQAKKDSGLSIRER